MDQALPQAEPLPRRRATERARGGAGNEGSNGLFEKDRVGGDSSGSSLTPSLEINRPSVEIHGTVSQLGFSHCVGVVCFRSSAAGLGIDFAADILPIRPGVTVAVQHGKHQMDEPDVSCIKFDLKTSDQVPAGMSIVAFTALANLDRCLHFQPYRLSISFHVRIDEIGISLMGIVLEGRVVVQSVTEDVGDKPLKLFP